MSVHSAGPPPLWSFLNKNSCVGIVVGPNAERFARFATKRPHPALQRGAIVLASIDASRENPYRFFVGEIISLTHSVKSAHGAGLREPSLKQPFALEEEPYVIEGTIRIHDFYRITEAGIRRIEWDAPPPTSRLLFLMSPRLFRLCVAGPDVIFPARLLGPQRLPAPIRCPSYGPRSQGGLEESWMGLIVGPQGSGKTMALSVLIGLWLRHPNMGLLIFDPHGQFHRDRFGRSETNGFSLHGLIEAYRPGGRPLVETTVTLADIRLEGTSYFVEHLVTCEWLSLLGIRASKTKVAAKYLLETFLALEQQQRWAPGASWKETMNMRIQIAGTTAALPFAKALAWIMSAVESGKARERLHDEIWTRIADPISGQTIAKEFNRAREPFMAIGPDGGRRESIARILREVLLEGKVRVVLAGHGAHRDDESEKLRLLNAISAALLQEALALYAEGRQAPCCHVVFDEAATLAPQHPKSPESSRLARTLKRLPGELRKTGVGVVFVTQSLVGFEKFLYRQANWRVYTHGLAVGADARYLAEREGKEIVEQYRELSDPRTSGVYPLMVCGSLQGLNKSGDPMFCTLIGKNDALLQEAPPLNGEIPQSAPEPSHIRSFAARS